MPPTDPPAFDRALIDSHRELLADDRAVELIGVFRDSLAVRRAELDAALAAGDVDAQRRAGHAIKGLAAAVGAVELAAVGERLQHASAEAVGAIVDDLGAASAIALSGVAAAWGIDGHASGDP